MDVFCEDSILQLGNWPYRIDLPASDDGVKVLGTLLDQVDEQVVGEVVGFNGREDLVIIKTRIS